MLLNRRGRAEVWAGDAEGCPCGEAMEDKAMTTKQTSKTPLGRVLSDKIQDFQVNLNFKSTVENLLVEVCPNYYVDILMLTVFHCLADFQM